MKIAILILVGLGLLLVLRGRALRRSTGLPWRRVAYQDTQRRELTRPLYSARYRLTGQPDYVLEHSAGLIPVEVKPTRRGLSPRQGDVLQLAAYCLLIEESTGTSPPYGLLRYAEATFEITWDDRLFNQLLDTLDAMREDLFANDVHRSHTESRRCKACGFVDRCSDALE